MSTLAKVVLALAFLSLAVGLASCSLLNLFNRGGAAQLLQSDKPRDLSPHVGQADLAELVAGNTGFAFDLYHAVAGEAGNLFYSPYSISLALAMTYAGARGQTEQQMASTLHFALPQDHLHPAFDALDLALTSRGQAAAGQSGAFQLTIANSIWGRIGYSFLPSFLDILAEDYGAGLRLLDFQKSPEDARAIINDWVSRQTNGKIDNLLPQGAITPDTRLVLTNAIYFKAAWLYPFDKSLTHDGTFHLLDGSSVTVPMMEERPFLQYGEGSGYQAVELPYEGQQLSMIILLPEAGQFTTFESGLDAQKLASIINQLGTAHVDLIMPKFGFKTDFSLKATLAGMGMPDAFSDQADFSGMTGKTDLKITDAFHSAFVSVDEAGTEAAAATGVVVGPTVAPPGQEVELKLDRPFVFLIRDVGTGTILFVGRLLNPKA